MAKAISPIAGQRYGIQRVCRLWDVPRSSFHAAQAPERQSAGPAPTPARRGPKPAIADAALLAAIKRDLETSPWTGDARAAPLDNNLRYAAQCFRVSREPGPVQALLPGKDASMAATQSASVSLQ